MTKRITNTILFFIMIELVLAVFQLIAGAEEPIRDYTFMWSLVAFSTVIYWLYKKYPSKLIKNIFFITSNLTLCVYLYINVIVQNIGGGFMMLFGMVVLISTSGYIYDKNLLVSLSIINLLTISFIFFKFLNTSIINFFYFIISISQIGGISLIMGLLIENEVKKQEIYKTKSTLIKTKDNLRLKLDENKLFINVHSVLKEIISLIINLQSPALLVGQIISIPEDIKHNYDYITFTIGYDYNKFKLKSDFETIKNFKISDKVIVLGVWKSDGIYNKAKKRKEHQAYVEVKYMFKFKSMPKEIYF